MPLVSLLDVLRPAQQKGFALGAFDTMDHAFTEGILQAAEDSRTPIILAAGDFPGPDYSTFLPYLVGRIARTTVPVCLHFDHGASYEACARAVRAGFSSVMIDGSMLPFEENIIMTKRVVEMAHACGVDVEGEIGHVGANASSIEGAVDDGSRYTEPEAAVEFVERTGVDALAVAVGTSHGVYKEPPQMDFERLDTIRAQASVPLVLHGGSGLSDDDFRRAIRGGICKINAFTNLTLMVTQLIREELAVKTEPVMSHEISLSMTKYAKEEVLRHIKIFETHSIN